MRRTGGGGDQRAGGLETAAIGGSSTARRSGGSKRRRRRPQRRGPGRRGARRRRPAGGELGEDGGRSFLPEVKPLPSPPAAMRRASPVPSRRRLAGGRRREWGRRRRGWGRWQLGAWEEESRQLGGGWDWGGGEAAGSRSKGRNPKDFRWCFYTKLTEDPPK